MAVGDEHTIAAGLEHRKASINHPLGSYGHIVGLFAGGFAGRNWVIPDDPIVVAKFVTNVARGASFPSAVIPFEQIGIKGGSQTCT